MSTLYGISRIFLKTDEYGQITDHYDDDYNNGEDILIIGKTHDFTREGKILINIIPENTLIYALDNETKLKTFGDLISYYGYKGCKVGDHDIIPLLGYENSIVGDQCRQCGKIYNNKTKLWD